tara:strand:- start:30 stop:356 length:327 start_codon:yes stop_codon:yes gene_type:complete
MCIGGSRAVVQPKPKFRNAPPIVTGSQIGVENPKDTKKATEELKIKRQKEEGTYIDPNLSMLEDSLTTRSGMSRADRARKKDNQARAKHNFNKRKFSRNISGRKTGTA